MSRTTNRTMAGLLLAVEQYDLALRSPEYITLLQKATVACFLLEDK